VAAAGRLTDEQRRLVYRALGALPPLGSARRKLTKGATMRRAAVAILTIAALGAATGAAAAGPEINHNCAGAVVSNLASPSFGSTVSDAAHQQAVDNFNLANCQQPPRNNP
jgi:hypothetical protein